MRTNRSTAGAQAADGTRQGNRPADRPAAGRAASHGLVTAVVCLALAAVVSAMASLNVALPDIGRDTRASQTRLEWIIDAYSLVFAALLLPAGALGDRFGRRKALIGGLVVFGAGSAAAMTAHSSTELIALRAVLGLGASLVMPATLSTITSTFPPAERSRAVSVWAGVAGASAIVGLLSSGALLEAFSWRSVFGLNVVLAVVALAGTVAFVPESASPDAPRLDLGGATLSVLGLVALVFSVVEAPEVGWLAARTLIGLALALVALVGFLGWEARSREPMLDPRLFRLRGLSAGTLSIFAQFFAFFGFVFVLLQYQQGVRGHSPLIAAVSVLPLAGVLMPTSRLAPVLAGRWGARRVCVSGLVLIAAGLTIISRVGVDSSYWQLLAGLIPLGAGMGTAMTPATTAVTEALPPAQQGVGSALNDLSREVGGAIGIAVIGSLLTATYRSHLSLPGVPAAVAGPARDSFGVAAHLGGPVAGHAREAFVSGLHVALLVGAGAALVAAVAVALLLAPGRPGAGAPGAGAPGSADEPAPVPARV